MLQDPLGTTGTTTIGSPDRKARAGGSAVGDGTGQVLFSAISARLFRAGFRCRGQPRPLLFSVRDDALATHPLQGIHLIFGAAKHRNAAEAHGLRP